MKTTVQNLDHSISRCRGMACQLRNECRRFLAFRYAPNPAASITNYTPNHDGSCNNMIHRDEDHAVDRL